MASAPKGAAIVIGSRRMPASGARTEIWRVLGVDKAVFVLIFCFVFCSGNHTERLVRLDYFFLCVCVGYVKRSRFDDFVFGK